MGGVSQFVYNSMGGLYRSPRLEYLAGSGIGPVTAWTDRVYPKKPSPCGEKTQ